MIGGFGNLPGEMDFWDLKNMKQLGKAKSHCAVGIEWAPDGTTLGTSVLYERVRVDNMITLFHADGTKLMEEPYMIDELYYCMFKPCEVGTYKVP
jgi:translation initiation factor 2A